MDLSPDIWLFVVKQKALGRCLIYASPLATHSGNLEILSSFENIGTNTSFIQEQKWSEDRDEDNMISFPAD